jgi:CDP-diacylglycerol--serine O-phosphatidyltransferase
VANGDKPDASKTRDRGPSGETIRKRIMLDVFSRHPRSGEQRLLRFKRVPVRVLLPNLVTLLALCSGVTAIRMGVEGRYELAVGAVIIAIVLDAVDGRLARLLKGTSKFGAELDSLADFVNFGVAPAVLIYFWSLQALRNVGWVVALALAICTALRLARFNVALEDPDKPAWTMNFFTGIPAPAGAGLAMAPMYLGFLIGVPDGKAAAWLILPYIALVAAGMVSRMPTYSGKTLGSRIHRESVLPLLLVVVLFAVMLMAFPWEVLSIVAALYLAMLPLSIRSHRVQAAAHARNVAAAETGSEPQLDKPA